MDDWRKQAACEGYPTDWWFEDPTSEEGKRAIEICEGCPVKDECHEWAMEHEDWGIWGGIGQKERKRLRSIKRVRLNRPEAFADLVPCGTTSAYARHIRQLREAGLPVKVTCEPCLAAMRRRATEKRVKMTNDEREARNARGRALYWEKKNKGMTKTRGGEWVRPEDR